MPDDWKVVGLEERTKFALQGGRESGRYSACGNGVQKARITFGWVLERETHKKLESEKQHGTGDGESVPSSKEGIQVRGSLRQVFPN